MPAIMPCVGCLGVGGEAGGFAVSADRLRQILAEVEADPDEPVLIFCGTCELLIRAIGRARLPDSSLDDFRKARGKLGLDPGQLPTDAATIERFLDLYREALAGS